VNRVFEAAVELDRFCRQRSWRFCIIGGVAVQRWGEPRGTQDVDLTIVTGFGTEDSYIDELLRAFEPRRPDARTFALAHRVLLLRSTNRTSIDLSLGALPFEERAVTRASDFPVAPDQVVRTCSAEDLVVLKVFAGREQDWVDVVRIVQRQGARLDEEQMLRELEPLLGLKGTPEAATRLREILRKSQ
jgi:predicted nucleotidyltransferase